MTKTKEKPLKNILEESVAQITTTPTKTDNIRLSEAIEKVKGLRGQFAIQQKGGKKYLQVQDRLEVFRNVFALDFGIHTQLIEATDNTVVIKAEVVRFSDNAIIATCYAEENRNQGYVNKTSAVENGETSAIGRALANLGMHGGEYATSNEIENAVEDSKTGNTTTVARQKDKSAAKAAAKFESAQQYLSNVVEKIESENDLAALKGYWKSTVDSLTTSKRLDYIHSNKKLQARWQEVNDIYVAKIETLQGERDDA